MPNWNYDPRKDTNAINNDRHFSTPAQRRLKPDYDSDESSEENEKSEDSEEVNEKSEDAEEGSKSEDESQEAGTVVNFNDNNDT